MNKPENSPPFRIGVIADTHGQLSQTAVEALQASQLIIHAGDLDSMDILLRLEQIAPVRAVRGNMDRRDGVRSLPVSEFVEIGEASIYVIHNLADLDLNPKAAGVHAVIHGHTHIPENKSRNGVLFVNPGSPSYPRRGSAPSVARMLVRGTNFHAELLRIRV